MAINGYLHIYGTGLAVARARRMEGGAAMKITTIFLTAFAVVLGSISSVWAGEFLGYPIADTQAKFYIMILGLTGASLCMVLASYIAVWIVEWKRSRPVDSGIWRLSFEDFSLSI